MTGRRHLQFLRYLIWIYISNLSKLIWHLYLPLVHQLLSEPHAPTAKKSIYILQFPFLKHCNLVHKWTFQSVKTSCKIKFHFVRNSKNMFLNIQLLSSQKDFSLYSTKLSSIKIRFTHVHWSFHYLYHFMLKLLYTELHKAVSIISTSWKIYDFNRKAYNSVVNTKTDSSKLNITYIPYLPAALWALIYILFSHS